MDYKKIYDQLVEKCKVRGLDKSVLDGYFEKHHIIPRCLDGSDEDENLVLFTAREHVVAHLLLWKVYPKYSGIINAAGMMLGLHSENIRTTSRVAAKLREENSTQRSLRKEGAGYGETRHIDLSGQRFGRLTVQNTYIWHYFPSGQRKAKWNCVCDCGNTVDVLVGALQGGYTKSCGCYQKEQTSKAVRKWTCSRSTYTAYCNMITRCYDAGHKSNHNFREYGIEVCESWMGEDGVSAFVRDMGEKPENLQLIRLDPLKDFCKENCAWVTKAEASKTMYKFPRKVLGACGKVGVKFDKRRNAYIARMDVDGKYLSKQFKTFEQAANQRDMWEAEYRIKAEI